MSATRGHKIRPKESLKQSRQRQQRSHRSETEEKKPIEATPEKLAEGKKYFGYDCAMCQGPEGDGKGDLAASMKLKMNDWRDSSRLEAMSDEESSSSS